MSKKILIIGSLNMDMVIEMEHMPLVGETILGKGISYVPGGKGANQAYATGKLGGNSVMLGCVGNDDFGKIQLENLARNGVDTSRMKTSGDQPTGTAVIYVNEGGDNSIVVIPGANSQCDVSYLKENEDVFRECDYVILQMEIPYDSIFYAVTKAKELGKTVILNPAPAPEDLPDEILRKIDYITPNETELLRLSHTAAESEKALEEGAKKLLKRGVGNVIVTVGEKGSMLVDGGGAELYPVRAVGAVDTTAAGDCFNGAFAVALSEGKGEEEAIRFANMASSITVTRNGAQTSIPDRMEVDHILERKA